MSLVLEIVSSQRRALGDKRHIAFGQNGGTIGRSLKTDWPLPDPKRYLSGTHASVDFHSGRYYIVDTSRNGVYINDSDTPVGRGRPQRLFAGDRVRIGEYVFLVSIDDADDTRATMLSQSHIDPVSRRQRVESPEPATYDLVDQREIQGSSIEMKLKEDSAPQPVQSSETGTFDAGVLLHAFFRGAGIEISNFDESQAEQLLFALGQTTREMIIGTMDCLHIRSIQKAQLRQSNTTVQPIDNNPLKFANGFEDGFIQLLINGPEHQMTPVESVRTAFADIKTHQQALLTSFRSAIEQYLDRLEPEQIESQANDGRKNALVNAANRYRYWDIYKDVYAVLATHPVDEFPQPFIDALSEAYQEAAGSPAAPDATEGSEADLIPELEAN